MGKGETVPVGELKKDEASVVFLPLENLQRVEGTGDNNVNNGEADSSSNPFLPPSDELSRNPYEGALKMVEEQNTDTDQSTKCACKNYTGIFLTLTSGFIFTCGGLIVKYMKDFHPVTLAVFRFQGVLIPAIIVSLYSHYVKKEEVISTVWPWSEKKKRNRFFFNCFRGCLGGFALLFLFTAIKTLSLADAILINSCRPVFVTLIAHIFLGEPCGVFPVFAALMTIVGVGVISRPPMLTGEESFNSETLIGCGLALIGMLTAAVSMTVLRYLREVHVSLVTLSFGFWGTLISVIGSFIIQRFDVPTTAPDISLAVCLALVTYFAQTMLTVAMRYEQASSVAIVRSCDAVFAFLLQFAVLGIKPDVFSLIGALLITSCVLMIAFRKWVTTLSDKDVRRKRYWFVLM